MGPLMIHSTEKIIAWTGCRFSKSKNNLKYSKANNKLYTPDEFKNALKNLNVASQFLCTYPLFFFITILNYII